jgi:hypothetical protein
VSTAAFEGNADDAGCVPGVEFDRDALQPTGTRNGPSRGRVFPGDRTSRESDRPGASSRRRPGPSRPRNRPARPRVPRELLPPGCVRQWRVRIGPFSTVRPPGVRGPGLRVALTGQHPVFPTLKHCACVFMTPVRSSSRPWSPRAPTARLPRPLPAPAMVGLETGTTPPIHHTTPPIHHTTPPIHHTTPPIHHTTDALVGGSLPARSDPLTRERFVAVPTVRPSTSTLLTLTQTPINRTAVFHSQ